MTDLSRPSRRLLIGGAAGLAAAPATLARAAGGFPPGFLWGAATSGHQVEGNNLNSDIWLLEHLKPTPFAEPSRDAVDHYHRFAEDIRLLASFGLNAFRFSVEWARTEPEPGEVSRAELEHYRRVAATCREHGVTPVLTFNHYTVPRWFAARGGFETAAGVDPFVRYCETVVAAMGDLVGVASVFNEPNIGRLLRYILPPQIFAQFPRMMQGAARAAGSDRFSTVQFADQDAILPNMIAAYEKAYPAIKGGRGDFPVGVSLAITDDQAVGPGSVRDARRADLYGAWLESARRTGDFIGVQTYGRNRWDSNGRMEPPAGARMTQAGEEFYPQALESTIRYAYAATGKPIYVTENGVGTEDDRDRVEYIRAAVHGVENAIASGVPVRSYIHWSLMDNFEWVTGYGQKMGLVAVDRTTQARTPKPSARFLGQIARTGRIPA